MFNHKHNEEAVSPIIATILLVGITVILSAIIAAYVFGMAGSQPQSHVVAIHVTHINETFVNVVNHGGQDQMLLTGITVSGDIKTPGPIDPDVGSSGLFELTGDPGQSSVVAVGTFMDGATQVLMDGKY